MIEITSISLLTPKKGSGKGFKIDSGNSGAIDAVKFILSVLKQHEKDLDRLITELGHTAGKLKKIGALTDRIQLTADRLSASLKEISGLERPFFPSSSKRPVVATCKQWEDFKSMSTGAETVSFRVDEAANTVQVYALKDGWVITYCYDFAKGSPHFEKSLKTWMSRELDVTEDKIFEGSFAGSDGN
jgi:hypothetical protein